MERISDVRLRELREGRGSPAGAMEVQLIADELLGFRNPTITVQGINDATVGRLTCMTCGQPQTYVQNGRCDKCRNNQL